MTNHIILTAFGTTTRAQETYHYLDKRIAHRFPECSIHWAFSSPTVRRNSAQKGSAPPASLVDMVSNLKDPGKIVIQSLHVLPGHEFDRTVSEAGDLPFPAAIGMPLLHGNPDFIRVAGALKGLIENSGHGAALILGHGTNHPCRDSYAKLEAELHKQIGSRIFFTTIEKPVDPPEVIIQKIGEAGYQRIFCVPFLLVAGMHFFKDINGDHHSSWRNLLKAREIEIDLHELGLAYLEGIDEIFCDHIQSAFDSMNV